MRTEVEFTCSHCGNMHIYECVAAEEFRLVDGKAKFAREGRISKCEIEGAPWVTNGHIIIRAERAIECAENQPLTAAVINHVRQFVIPYESFIGIKPARCGVSVEKRVQEFSGVDHLFIDDLYYRVLSDCDDWRYTALGKPVQAFRNGIIQGAVMRLLVRNFEPDQEGRR